MIVAAVVCPHPPLLLRELCGAEDTVPELRAACRKAVGSLLSGEPDAVVVVGGGETTRAWDPSLPLDVRRFGTTAAPEVAGLPQSLGVGRRLLDEAGWAGPVRMHTVAWDAGPTEVADVAAHVAGVEGRVVLLVLGDGSARRGVRAPGHLDERAFAFDDETARALEEGDAEALTRVDPALAEELLSRGRAALAVLGQVALTQGTLPRAELLHRDDPHGVDYVVASWALG
ncbi:MAG TPA: hypothetical protein VFZ64_03980 [Nocardioidaceae bacterium]